MARTILINLESMEIVAASDQPQSAKCLSILADIMKLPDNYIVMGCTMGWFKKIFSFDEMLKLYVNTTGDEIKRAMPDTVIYQCIRIAENFKAEERTCTELEKALGRPFVVVKTPAPERSSKSETKGVPSRPKAGTTTGAVWEICDSLLSSLTRLPTKEEILQETRKKEINDSTASTQYSKWKRAQ